MQNVFTLLFLSRVFRIAISTRRKRVSFKIYIFISLRYTSNTDFFQLLLEYDELSWKEREWFSVYSPNAASNFPQYEVDQKQLNL